MHHRILIFFMSIAPAMCYSQLDNSSFYDQMSIEEADSNKLYLALNILGFGKNNEYSETTVEGYTLFGYQVNPFLSYQISGSLRIDAGVYAQKDFGNNDYTEILPTFSIKYKHRDLSVILGTLEGSLNHRLIEPLYDFEGVITRRIENGIQTLLITEDLFLDVWVDWQNMIYQNDPEQEEFFGGLSFAKKINSGGLTFNFPLQTTVYHRGGQIDANPNPVLTFINGAAGIEFNTNSTSVWGVKSYFVMHTSSSGELPYKTGSGIFVNPYLKTKFGLTLMGSLWSGNEYLTRSGGVLYPSISAYVPSAVDETRTWIMLRALYEINLVNGATLSLRAEPFYDTFSKKLEYSYGLYINVNTRFFLTNANK
jgi:hypothetical protein